MSPIACCDCGDTDGPFTTGGLCEDCEPAAALHSALEVGGWLDDNATRLMGAYAAAVLRTTAVALRMLPDCEAAAQIVGDIARAQVR